MLFKLRLTFPGQFTLLAVSAALSAAIAFGFHYFPLLRLTPGAIFGGLTAGVILSATLILLRLAAILGFRGFREALSEDANALRGLSSYGLFGAAAVRASGEELFLRSFLFGCFAADYFWLALGATLLLTFALNFRGKRFLPACLFAVIEAAFFSVLYFRRRSLALLATAAFIEYLLTTSFLRSKILKHLLNLRRMTWREMYAVCRRPQSYGTETTLC